MYKALVLSSVAALMLSSCAMGPNFHGAPDQGLPESWVNHMPPATDSTTLDCWWATFGDPQLSDLIARGKAANPDMVTAALSIAKSQSQLHQAQLDFLPTLGVTAGGNNSGDYDTKTSHGSWNSVLSLSWTPDIWGATRREVEAAVATIGSQRAAADATEAALASSIAAAYFQWISAKESLRIAQEQLAYQEHTYSIAKRRYDSGMSSGLDLSEAAATIATTRARIPQYEAGIKGWENSLATLLGTTVDKIHLVMPSESVYNRVPAVPTGLPSELLRRRPDIVQAECELHAATAGVGQAKANLFPQLSLTGTTGTSAGTDFSKFWQNSTWNLAGSLTQSALNRTVFHELYNQAKLERDMSVQNYRKTVLAAFAEVEGCLIDYAQQTSQLPRFQEAADANRRSAELSVRLYNAGESDYLNVAEAQRQLLNSELNVISTRQSIRIALAKLCTALGGGWDGTRFREQAK